MKIIDWKAIEEQVKKTLGTEEEPFEGKVPLNKVEDAVLSLIHANPTCQYVFDSFPLHESASDF